MKNIFNKFAFFIALSFLFISCGNLTTSENDDSIPQGKGKITISTDLDSQSRSVLPTGITEQTQGLTWELVGTCEEKTYSERWNDTTSEDGSVTSTAYNNMKNDNDLLLDVGTWLFSLKVKNNNGYVLVGTTQVAINSGENTLSFVMNEATSDDLSDGETVASGSIEFTLNFPTGVINKGIATLTPLAGGNSFTQEFTADAASTNQFLSSITYTNENISAGYYILKIQLQQEGYATTPAVEYINTYSCLIRVAPGLTSYGVYTLDKLAQLYTIKYECGQGNIENQLITTSYNAYTSFELPEPTYQGHYFAGWYIQELKEDNTITETLFGNAGETKTISEDITLYAKWVKAYTFNLYDSTGKEVENSYKVENGIGSVTLDNTGNSVWDYYLKSTDIKFTEKNNYKITVEMKAEADSVVAIQAANSDMFFTVGTEWTPCTMETGFIEKELDASRNGISFGIGLSQKTYFRNLVIEEIDDDGLPTLVFDITTEGINQYLNTQNKADKIIEVEKVVDASGMATGYAITINAPLSHKDENNVVQQDVKLHLRDYAKSVGANNVSFEVKNTGNYPFATSFMADTASNNSMAWNNVRTEVGYSNYVSCNIDFPNYEANDELTVDVITGSDNVYSNYPVEFTISEFKVEEPVATAGPFNGKIFAIQVGETWTQGKSVEVTIPVNNNKEFDVGMFNGWNGNMPSSFADVTRFFYTGDANITDNLSYSSDPNAPTYTITNDSSSDVKVKITLDADYKVQIEEVENQPIDLTTDSLQTYFESSLYRLPTGEYRVTDNLTLSAPIYIDNNSTVKIYADNDVKITPDFATGSMINLPMSSNSKLTLGGGNGTLTLNGTGILSGSVISSNTSLIIEDGFKLIDCDVCAINVTSGTFTMNGGEITNISREGHIINIAGGTAIFNGGSIYNNECVDLWGTSYCIYVDTGTLNIPSNSTTLIYDNYSSVSAGDYDTEKGAFIYNNKGTVTILGSDLAQGTCYEEPINSGSSGIVTNADVSTFSELKNEIESVIYTAYTLDNPYVIGITSSFDTGTDITATTNVKSHIKLVAINSDGCTITKNASLAAVNIFTVAEGASLTLGDSNAIGELIIDGNETLTTTTQSLINVSGTLVLNEKSTLQNNKCKEGYATNGAAVYSKGGTVKILGGTVKNNSNSYENNTGGAIYIDNNGTFEMTAGVVSNNSSYASGGAIYVKSSTVTISGGTFDMNEASNKDKEYVHGGGLISCIL